jgi:hypothetical protein
LFGSEGIFAFDLSIEGRIWILVLSASRNGTFISPESFNFSTVDFLISRLPPTSNEIPPFFFFFSSMMISYLSSILNQLLVFGLIL